MASGIVSSTACQSGCIPTQLSAAVQICSVFCTIFCTGLKFARSIGLFMIPTGTYDSYPDPVHTLYSKVVRLFVTVF